MTFQLLVIFSALSFFIYGTSCLVSRRMKKEFRRFGLEKYRWVTGMLQLAGAAGLLSGLRIPTPGMAAAAGLAVLMLLGVGVRIRIRDGWRETFPASLYMVFNAYLSFAFAGLT